MIPVKKEVLKKLGQNIYSGASLPAKYKNPVSNKGALHIQTCEKWGEHMPPPPLSVHSSISDTNQRKLVENHDEKIFAIIR